MKRGNIVSRQVAPLNLYNNTRMRTVALSQRERLQYMRALPDNFSTKNLIAPANTIHRGAAAFLPKKAGLQTFLHSQAPSQTII